ncbi:CSLREA domain-containing protein [Acinetobacter sp. ANC 5414]|uniref:CSLREA domain-containing protein n=1 Tax=Acinetobacter sp. ANC 5414 TaxID=2731251 RepID=UPI0014905E38|nr:CSLREA domain-containing protein [Acinetobacter sp. ANC 5414]NNH00852.1 CSLREA domain-containing protein [Acinetobacter sp. ANC 5414]
MHTYKKGLLCVMVLSAMSLMAAEDRTIYVTTFADENGENASACSLREAIITAKKNAAYGGCTPGNTVFGQTDYIQLEAGRYKLDSELAPESMVIISGASRENFKEKNKLTQTYPALEGIKTMISGEGRTRIFNTSKTEISFTLNNIQLENGYAGTQAGQNGRGGAVLIGGDLIFKNGAIVNSKAEVAGGAIYNVALNSEKKISINGSLIQGNTAAKGSVIAMDCYGNLDDTKPVVYFERNSIINNGSSSSLSAFDFCGSAKVDLITNTIAQNKASTSNGSILRMVTEGLNRLSPFSDIKITSNTIVENEAYSTLLYDDNGIKSVSFNVLAYNQGGKSCRYYSGSGVPKENIKFFLAKNALNLGTGVDQCMLPKSTLDTTVENSKNIDVSTTSFSTLLSELIPASPYNMFLPLYYPRNNQTATDLIDVNSSGCSDYDQRLLERADDTVLQLNPDLQSSCDIGSVEQMNLAAVDITDLKNSSLVTLLDYYQKNIDELRELITESTEKKEDVEDFKEELANFENLLKYTKQYQKYRAIYFNPFELAIAGEERVPGSKNEEYRIKVLDTKHYDIIAEPFGIGVLTVKDGQPVLNGSMDDLKCEWKADLKRIMIYRTSGNLLENGDSAYCKYTIKEKAGTAQQSSGILKVSFTNIAPVAKNDVYKLDASKNLTVTVNPVENDNDDGDGTASDLPEKKSAFHKNEAGQDIPIRFAVLPAGLSMKAEFEGPCPEAYIRDTCYGGKIEFTVKNAFSQFDYPIDYAVFDAEGAISNTATLLLKNTAKDTNSSGGGGSFGIYGLLALIGLGLYRRKMK